MINKSIEKMQSLFVFGGGVIKTKFKSKLSLLWCVVFSLIKAYFLKWGQCRKLSIFEPTERDRKQQKVKVSKKTKPSKEGVFVWKKQINDKSKKDYWINCYKCGTWCCPDCLPETFKSKVKEV